jgi:hypothetical protein
VGKSCLMTLSNDVQVQLVSSNSTSTVLGIDRQVQVAEAVRTRVSALPRGALYVHRIRQLHQLIRVTIHPSTFLLDLRDLSQNSVRVKIPISSTSSHFSPLFGYSLVPSSRSLPSNSSIWTRLHKRSSLIWIWQYS